MHYLDCNAAGDRRHQWILGPIGNIMVIIMMMMALPAKWLRTESAGCVQWCCKTCASWYDSLFVLCSWDLMLRWRVTCKCPHVQQSIVRQARCRWLDSVVKQHSTTWGRCCYLRAGFAPQNRSTTMTEQRLAVSEFILFEKMTGRYVLARCLVICSTTTIHVCRSSRSVQW